jgi:Spy/CpxP family protein refolding chaperone
MTRKDLALGAIVIAIAAAAAVLYLLYSDSASPYAGLETREIAALSAEDVEGLREGNGMGYALTAELNGYPGPRHVLDLADKLELTPEQKQKTEELFAAMKSETMPLGERVIEAERKLNELFTSRKANAQQIGELTAKAALVEGELRAAHLKYHLNMMDVLTPDQVSKYVSLRGYLGGHHGQH